jgi:hypothetical protein
MSEKLNNSFVPIQPNNSFYTPMQIQPNNSFYKPEETNNFLYIVIFIFILFILAAIYFYNSKNCIVGDWSTCNGTSQTRTVTQATYGGTACTTEQKATTRPCNNCIVSPWGACNGTSQTRTVTQATNGGTACTAEQNVKSRACNNCITSLWGACNGTSQTRTVTQATNGGTECTAEQNVKSRPCNNCITSLWGDCDGNNQTRIVTQATNGGTKCTAEQNVKSKACGRYVAISADISFLQKENIPGCSVTDWSDCSGGMQYREIKGDKCSANARAAPVAKECNSCIVSRWSDCSGGMQHREVTSLTGGIPCTAAQNVKSRTCDSSPASWDNPHSSYPGCYIGDWSECVDERQYREIDGCWSDDKKYRLPEAQTCSSPDTYITVYPEPNYQGTGVKLFPPSWYNMYTLKALGMDDNIISSIKVQPGVKATLYDGGHHTGNSKVITSDVPNLANIDFDNYEAFSYFGNFGNLDFLTKPISDPDLDFLRTKPISEPDLDFLRTKSVDGKSRIDNAISSIHVELINSIDD